MEGGRIFLTGASGFVGRRLLGLLEEVHGSTIHALSRSPQEAAAGGNVRWIRGELGELDSYREALAECDTVVHLAALVGSAPRDEFFRVNTEGTRRLIEACRQAGVERFLFVSTIAAGYPEKRHYPYAASKEQAEELVRECGLDWVIVRPTIVLGPGSAALAAMKSFAGLPIVPLLGGGAVRVQPIEVGDLAGCLLELIEGGALPKDCWELGGPEVLSFGELLGRLHEILRGAPARSLRLPVRSLISCLAAVEKLIGPRLPVTAGQLYAFVHDSDARSNPLHERRAGQMLGVSAMLERSLVDDGRSA